MGPVPTDIFFQRPTWVVVRPQKGQYLLYNSRTDELHLIPPTGHAVYALCDGLRSIHDISAALSDAIDAEPALIKEHVAEFLGSLETRGLVERVDG